MSNTRQFDKALDEYFAKLVLDENGGQWRTCRFSGQQFYVRPEDIEFYKKIHVPPPTLSPLERSRRRMAFASGYTFYRVKSAATGASIISVYPPNTPFKIYEHQRWFSDQWDPLEFGALYDQTRPFLDQFEALHREVPRPNLFADTSNINSEFTNTSHHLKDSYMTFDGAYGENQYYSEFCPGSNDCVDCWTAEQSEQCYKSWGTKLWKCIYCHYSFECLQSAFLYDCTNCEYCFMSANLRNKKYYFYNEPLTKEEYERRTRAVNLGNYEVFQKHLRDFEELKGNAIRKNTYNNRVINSVGDWLLNSRDCFQVLFAQESERLAYCQGLARSRDSYDCIFGYNGELNYEVMAVSMGENNYDIKFSSFVTNSRDGEYSDLCYNCHDCFGCVGLQNRSFCILNTQYTEAHYGKMVGEIKTAMLSCGEYGEFFPPRFSSFPYRASLAVAYQGYGDLEEVGRYGYCIEEIPQQAESEVAQQIISSHALPLDIADVDDSILDKVILDEEHNKKFRITRYELEFYRKYNLPLPRVHPLIRMNQWRKEFDLRLRFFERPCAKCGEVIQTTYALERPEKNIYCERCYLEEIG